MPDPTPAPTLADLRREIDRIDEAMHRLLMERGEIIDTLIRTKGTSDSGQAFRPGREASMMRALAERHRKHFAVGRKINVGVRELGLLPIIELTQG